MHIFYFTGKDNSLSTSENIMRYDVEVSGFPSSHAGHIVLLRIKEDDFPGTTTVEQWPSWTLPILKWAKEQGGVVGYAHSGWGLEPVKPVKQLPNYELPRMDGIGANEYVVAVTQGLVDFLQCRRHAAIVGIEYVVPHVELRIQNKAQRRDGFSLYHR